MQGMSLIRTTARRALVAAKSLLLTMGLVPNAIGALRLASRSPNGLRDLYAFWLLRHVQEFAHRRGEWQTIVRLIRERGGA